MKRLALLLWFVTGLHTTLPAAAQGGAPDEKAAAKAPAEKRLDELFKAAERFDALNLAECNRLLPESKKEDTLKRLVGVTLTATMMDGFDKERAEPKQLSADEQIERLYQISQRHANQVMFVDFADTKNTIVGCTSVRSYMSYGFAMSAIMGAVYPSDTFDRFIGGDKKKP